MTTAAVTKALAPYTFRRAGYVYQAGYEPGGIQELVSQRTGRGPNSMSEPVELRFMGDGERVDSAKKYSSVRAFVAYQRKESATVTVDSFGGPRGAYPRMRVGWIDRAALYEVRGNSAEHLDPDDTLDVVAKFKGAERTRILGAMRKTAADGKSRKVKVAPR